MKRKKFEKLMEPHMEAICRICEEYHAPVAEIGYITTLSKSARLRGDAGKVCVYLNDTEPGWRKQDNPEARRDLKQEIRNAMLNEGISVSVAIFASYSSVLVEDGVTYHRDNLGNVVSRSGEEG